MFTCQLYRQKYTMVCKVSPDSYPEYKSRMAQIRCGILNPLAAAWCSSTWTCAAQLCNAQSCWWYVIKPDSVKGFTCTLLLLAST